MLATLIELQTLETPRAHWMDVARPAQWNRVSSFALIRRCGYGNDAGG